jgi:recombination protein RecT
MNDISKNKDIATANAVVDFLEKQKDDFEAALSTDQIMWAKECTFAKQLIMKNNYAMDIARKNPLSLQNAILNVAACGITLNPLLAHAYLVPRDGGIMLDVSYKGLLQLATDCGAIEWVQTWEVYDNDTFQLHGAGVKPTFSADPRGDRGDLSGFVCVAKTPSGGYLTEWMSKDDVDDIARRSKTFGKETSPWKSDYKEMGKKTVIKRASKRWPYSKGKSRMDTAVSVANAFEGIEFQPRHTEEDKATLEHLMALNDAPGMFVWTQSLDIETEKSLFGSFPQGQKTALKSKYRDLVKNGHTEITNTLALIKLDHQNGDESGAKEKLDELSPEVREYIINSLTAEEHEWIKAA